MWEGYGMEGKVRNVEGGREKLNVMVCLGE